jgi:hypothetical protein
MDVAALVCALDSGEISNGTRLGPWDLPKGPVVAAAYRGERGEVFEVYGIRLERGLLLLYLKDDLIYAACGYALSAGEQEKWWFVDGMLLGQHASLAQKTPKPWREWEGKKTD